MATSFSRFQQRVTGPAKAARVSPVPAHSPHTASMLAQANRVPRLRNLNAVKGFSSAVKGGGVKGGKR